MDAHDTAPHHHDPASGKATDPRRTSVRWRLREETRAEHERLDAAITALDLTTRQGYRAFIAVNASVLPGLEAAIAGAGIERALPDWPARARADALMADASGMGVEAPAAVPVEPPASPAAAMGAAYVLEGSRLGGVLLDRRALASGDADVEANRRFLTHGAGSRLWPDFLAALDAAVPDEVAHEAVEGARAAFLAYEEAVRRVTDRMAGDTSGAET